MLKTRRRLPQFDCLEGKVLLSVGMANPAASAHRETAKRFLLNGSLSGLQKARRASMGLLKRPFLSRVILPRWERLTDRSAWRTRSSPSGRSPISTVRL